MATAQILWHIFNMKRDGAGILEGLINMIFQSYLPHQATLRLWQRAGLFCTLRESSKQHCKYEETSKQEVNDYSLTHMFFLTTIWENCCETRRCAASSFTSFGVLCVLVQELYFRPRDARLSQSMAVCFIPTIVTAVLCPLWSVRYVLENTISRRIPHGMHLNKKSWIQHSWLRRLDAKHWAHSCTDICTNNED